MYICVYVCVCAELVPFWELPKTNNGNVKQFSGFAVALLCTARWGAAQRDAANDGKKKKTKTQKLDAEKVSLKHEGETRK